MNCIESLRDDAASRTVRDSWGTRCSRDVCRLQRVSEDTPWILPWRLALVCPCLETVLGKRLQPAGVAQGQVRDGARCVSAHDALWKAGERIALLMSRHRRLGGRLLRSLASRGDA
jgi:hypothetical protein